MALSNLLDLSTQRKKVGLSEERVRAVLPIIRQYTAFWREYPDLFVDSVGELIEMCEKEGYIERYYIEQPNDKVDFTIRDMQRYTRTLIEEETNLSDMIEMALKQNAKEDEDAKANEEFDIIDDDDLAYEDLERNVVDKDFEDFNDFIDAQREEDENMFLTGDKV